ncbi:prolyl oligopeptidase family serine peptidase [Streptomyces alfalfae]
MDAPDLPRQFARTGRFTLGAPQGLTLSEDGRRLLFTRSGAGDDPVGGLWLYEDGAERLLVDPLRLGAAGPETEAERVRRERAREVGQGVVAFAADRHARVVAFALGGALWVVEPDGRAPRRVRTAGPAFDPRPSPDGTLIAYVTGGALRVVGADGTDDRALAEPEGSDVTYGVADHVAAESMDRHRGFWWSPAGDALLVARVDASLVRRWWLADPARPELAPRAVRYPAAGTANTETSLHILRLTGTRTRVRTPERAGEGHPGGTWTDDRFEYVPTAAWDAHGPLVGLQTRDQRSVHVLEVDAATGATRTVCRVRDEAWVPLVPGAPLRTPSGALVRYTAVDGDTRGLAVGEATTPAGLQVHEVVGAVGERVFFTASQEPTEIHVWSFDHRPSHRRSRGRSQGQAGADAVTRVSEGPGVHTAVLGGDTVVLDSRTPEGRTVTVLSGGEPAGRIGVLCEEPVVVPRPRHLTLGERELRATLYLPSWHEPGTGKLPVLLCPYGGPGLRLVVHARVWWTVVAQWFAEQGFAVLVVDGRGTPGRGIAWERAVHGDQLTPVLDDQVDALHAAAGKCPDLDLGRVGIRGWSFGGYLAAGAVLHRPDVFHAAVAGAAPTELELYDTHWKERYLGHPDVHPEQYERCSLVAHAHRLTRPLMLVHGLADDNVFPAHLLRFSSALLAAGRRHTVLPLSGASHLVSDQEAANLLRCELDFLKSSLGSPPAS